MTITNAEDVTVARELPGIGLLEFVQSEKSRAYWLTPDGHTRRTRLPSVTGILRDTWPKPQLLEWYAREGANAATVLSAASVRGKAVHRFIETFLTTGELLAFDDFPPEYRGYLTGAARFLWETDPRPMPGGVERLVCHPELRYAGRPDLVALIDGAVTLVDFKSNPKGVIYKEAHVQTVAYVNADHRCGGEPIERTLLVGLGDDGSVNPVPGNLNEAKKVWGAVLDFHGQLKRLDKALGS